MKKFLAGYTTVTNKVCYYLCYVSMIMIACMMVLMFVDSMLGLLSKKGLIEGGRIAGTYELVQVMLLVVVFSSWAYTQTVHGHIHVVMFVRMFPQKIRFICFGLTAILSCFTMAFAAYAVYGEMFERMKTREATATLLIPYWPLFIFEFLAFALLAIVLLCEAIKSVCAIVDKELADEIMSTWT